ncbi:CCCH zinc finger protein [Phyllosticta citribraziliensis]|uniref:CCCH zinc finger protein n=1 Tax=Phyllosticta citribraziliensis TaxID=989973 RepID=A0ABR1LZL8_9PEZI
MSEDRELQAKIAALSGKINLAKQRDHTSHGQQTQYGYGRGSANWTPHRGTPYGAPRGRGGKMFNNRTLVLNSSASRTNSPVSAATPTEGTPTSEITPSPRGDGNGWVVKRDRHMQLINPAIYDKVAQQRAKDMEQTAEQRRQQRSLRERAKLNKHFQAAALPVSANTSVHNPPATSQSYEIDVEGVRFRVADGGSKLIRVSNDPITARVTPKHAKIGGVTFLRSKNGNLYRAGIVKTRQTKPVQKISEPCPRFTTTGTCSKGPQCRYLHDPHKVDICKDFLLRNNCPLGDACDLSHEPSPHRVPACLHFLRGNCTNDDCRYAHIRVNPSAPVCRAFGTIGYCEKGPECTERHVFECPDYANHAVCRNPKCRLPHVDRAGQIRKAASAQNGAVDSVDMDISSDDDEQINSDDVDSDAEIEEEIIMTEANDQGHEVSRQQDFIGF